MSTKLKLLGVDVGSIGDAHGNQNPGARMFRYLDPIKQEYRKLVVSSDGKKLLGAMLVGKGFDTFCPLGPVIATGLDPSNLELISRVNGETRQETSTSDLLFSVAELVSYLSRAMTLLPGDVIMTGTPGGVGPIAPGDTVEIELSGVGVLRNPVEQE